MNVTILTKKSNGSLWVFLDSFNHDKITYYVVSDATDYRRSIERADNFDMSNVDVLINSAVKNSPLVGKMVKSSKDSMRAGFDAKCLAHFTGLFSHQYLVIVNAVGGMLIVAAEDWEVVSENLELEGGEFVVSPVKPNVAPRQYSDVTEGNRNIARANGLCYPTKESAEAAMADIVRFCRLRRLADMVNGDGVVNSVIQRNYGVWSQQYAAYNRSDHTVAEIFTVEGAAKACELLNSGKFKL